MDNENIKTTNGENEMINNSEILFIYECVTCNPNGDPDDENKPRMDYNSNRNLVSDVRLKRYIRDFIENSYKEDKSKKIFVTMYEGAAVNAKTSLANILEKENAKKIALNDEEINNFLTSAIDVRMFGAIIPDVTSKKTKGNLTFTGPIQFNWGYSLNKVDGPMPSSGITSHFHSGQQSEDSEATKGTGAMGKDYRLAYSLIAFYGIINGKRSEQTKLTTEDIKLFDMAMVKAIPMVANTKSKIGQTPLFYLRVEYNGNDFFTGDLRKYVKITNKEDKEMNFDDTLKLRSTYDFKLDLSKLKEKMKLEKVKSIIFWKNEDLELLGWEFNNDNYYKIIELNPEDSNSEK